MNRYHLRFKSPEVSLDRATPECLRAIAVCMEVYGERSYGLTLTSGNDGEHMAGSKHYTGDAFDARTKHLAPGDKPEIVVEIRRRLGRDYDVLHELEGDPREHLHVEWDPKVPVVTA